MKLLNHKKFRIIFAIEIAYLVVDIVLLLIPNKKTEYSLDKFSYEAGIPMESFAYSSDPGIYIDNSMMPEDQQNIDITLSNINLMPGSYQIVISYSSSDDNNTYTCVCDNDWTDFWKLENIGLSAGEDQKEFIDIASVLPAKEMSVSVSYNGDGYLYLSSIQITRTKSMAAQSIYYGLLIILLTSIIAKLWFNHNYNGKKALFILLTMVFISSLPLFGMLLGYGDDLDYHLLRIDALADGLRNGQFPVRISTYWNNGYGYASSLFYNDLFLMFPAFLRLLGISVQNAYKQYVIACNFATVCIAWHSFRKMFNRKTSIIGTLLYVFQPYRLSCLYKRAAVGEYTAMIFFPLIVWGIYKIYTAEPVPKEIKGHKRIVYNIKLVIPAVLGYSGVVSSHVISTLLVGTITMLFCIVMIQKTLKPVILLRLFATAGIIVLINAWYLVPMADSMRSGISANSIASIRHIQKHGTYIYQLFDIFPHGDGQSYFAQDEINPQQTGDHDMSYAAGAGIIGVIMWIYYLVTNKIRKSRIKKIGGISCAFCILCLFMTSIWFPWDFLMRIIPGTTAIFGNIQFPWRLLGLAGAFSALNTMCLMEVIETQFENQSKYIIVGAYLAIISLTLISAMYFLHSYEVTTRWEDYTSDAAVPTTQLHEAEYLPDNTDREMFNDSNPTCSNTLLIYDFERHKDSIILFATNSEDKVAYVDVPFLYYPGYVAKYQETGQMLDTIKAPDNRVRVIVPAEYNGTISVKYRERIRWRLTELISLISVISIVAIIFKRDCICYIKNIT